LPHATDPFSHETAANTGVLLPNDALAVHITENNAGAYATDTWSMTDRFAVTASVRVNHTRTEIADRSGRNPELDGQHSFQRLNPALGATYQLSKNANAYFGYSESTRAPTPVELTCASPTAPCKLPNDFVADPDLRQVIARNIEAGVRGTLVAGASSLRWQADLFRTVSAHDILFQATGGAQSNEGFFANVGNTRRQGLELALSGRFFENRLDVYANYALVDATFLTPFMERSANHPSADLDGLIDVARGDRIPGIPRSAFKLGADYRLTSAFQVGCDVVYNSARWLRGDEANELRPLGGYTLLNLRGNWRLGEHLSLFARLNNVFDRRNYASFGTLGNASVVYPSIADPRFASPGEPRSMWVGASVEM
jgi:outer membrane receptor protein involved in Fe transport